MTRLYMDDSLERGAYACISTFHFGNPDFTNSSPFLMHYQGKIPFTGMHDAHGTESWWWGDMLTGYRTLFLAKEPTYAALREALAKNWVGAARHDAVSGGATWMHTGNAAVREFLDAHPEQWQWWDNPRIQRPKVSLVAVSPDDEFEAGRPERGVTLRVRCYWDNTAQGQPKTQRTELVRLTLDGKEVTPERKESGGRRGLSDVYHAYPVDAAGPHKATVTVRNIATGEETTRSLEFLGI